MHVPLHGRHEDLPLRLSASCAFLFRFHKRLQICDCFFHDARALDDLWQEHLAGAEQIPDDVHPGH